MSVHPVTAPIFDIKQGSRSGKTGDSCNANGSGDCASGVCIHQAGAGVSSGYTCSAFCDNATSCPTGWLCRSVSPVAQHKYCIPPTRGSGRQGS